MDVGYLEEGDYKYTSEQTQWFVDEMNGLPRKQLDYATPEELFRV